MDAEYVPIPGFSKYVISKQGKVKEISTGSFIEPICHMRGYLAVKLCPDDRKTRTIQPNLAKTVLMTFDPLQKTDHYSFASANFLNGNTEDVRFENLEWDFGKYVPRFIPGINLAQTAFVKVPGYSLLEINGLGQIRYKNRSVYPYLGANGYYCFAIYHDSTRDLLNVHVLMALTFLEHPVDVTELVVNHKNGITTDNSLSNLEWTTYRGNVTHAFTKGLRDDNKPIFVMEIQTRTISEYYSLGAFCRAKDLDNGTLWNRLRFNRPIRPYFGYYVKYKDDARPWPEAGYVATRQAGVAEKIRVFDIATKKERIFDSIAQAAKEFKVNPSSLAYQCRKELPSPYIGRLFKPARDTTPWPEKYV